MINLALHLPNEVQEKFLLNLEKEQKKETEIFENINKSYKISSENLNFIIYCIKLVEQQILEQFNVDKLLKEGFFELFLSPQLRFNEDLIKDLYFFFINIRNKNSEIIEFEFKNIQSSENFKLHNIITTIYIHFHEKVKDIIKIFKSDEFYLLIVIYYLYKKLKEEVYKQYDCLELNEEHISIFDMKFINSIIIVFKVLNPHNNLNLNLDNFDDILNNFCYECYEKLELKFHPFPWTCL